MDITRSEYGTMFKEQELWTLYYLIPTEKNEPSTIYYYVSAYTIIYWNKIMCKL